MFAMRKMKIAGEYIGSVGSRSSVGKSVPFVRWAEDEVKLGFFGLGSAGFDQIVSPECLACFSHPAPMLAVGVVGKVVVVVAGVKMVGDAPLSFVAYAKRSVSLRFGSA